MIKVKRAYDPPAKSDGVRILVDRLWPRGLTKEAARIDEWRRDLSPSDGLRKWFGHDPEKWPEFRRRFTEELKEKTADLREIARQARQGTVTLVFAAKDAERCNAAVLRGLLDRLAK